MRRIQSLSPISRLAVYENFLTFLSSLDYENLSTYQIVKLYFAQLDEYYSGAIKIVSSMSEEGFNNLLAKAQA